MLLYTGSLARAPPSPNTGVGNTGFKVLPVKAASNVQNDSGAVTSNALGAATSPPSLLRPPLLLHIKGLRGSSEDLRGGRGGSADLADPLVRFKWNLRNEVMTSNREGKPGGAGVSFSQFPSSRVLLCSTDYSPMYPPPPSEAPRFVLPPGLIHPQTSILSCPPAHVAFPQVPQPGQRRGKERERSQTCLGSRKVYDSLTLKDSSVSRARSGIPIRTKHLEAASLSLTMREVSRQLYGTLGSCNSPADPWEKHHCVLSLFLHPPLGQCRRPLQETGSPLGRPLGLSRHSLSHVRQPCSDFFSTGKPCRQGKQSRRSLTLPTPLPLWCKF